MKILLSVIFSLLVCPAAFATTYYIRGDGGSVSQCTGLGNAPYPGSGTGQSCAWHHPFDALPPQGDGATPAIALHGGDTLIVGAGSYEMGANALGASAYPACNKNWSWDCFMASVPSGTASQPTRILGAGWDQGCAAPPQLWGSEHSAQVIALNGSSNVTIGCLEITDHSSCIESHLGGNSSLACNRSTPPFGPWASRGIYAKDAANVTLQDLNIHGMANRGILAGRLTNWTVSRVKIIANGWGGWDGDLADGAGSSNSGQMLFQSVEVGFNGCGESYPDKQIIGCWGQQEGGYGDGLGTTTTSGNWIFENSYFHHNTQDGLDLLYANTTATITVRQSHAEGNAGNQMKLAGSPTVQDSVIVGNCSYFQGKYNMSGDNSGGASTAGDSCRAMGNALVLSVQPTLKALVQYNTIAGEGDCLILAINGDASSSVAIQNNALIGKPDWVKANESPQPQSCLFYWDSGPATWPVTYAGNLVWQTKNNTCPSGTGNRCNVDPQLTDASLSSFNPLPLATSPLIDAASTSVPTLATDFLSLPRPAVNGYDIGAVEFQPSGSGGGQIPNQPPTAVASATITAGVAPLAVSFNGSGSSDPDGSIASYAWTFGDGSSASGATVAHTYTAVGSFSAKLTVTDNAGATASQSVTIKVSIPNQPPTAIASASVTAGVAPLAVSFNGSGSSDTDGSIASYAWTFGDGTTASGATTSHTYGAAGTYSAKLTVTDNGGATASQSVTISVSANNTAIIAPSGLSASSGKRGTVTLRWTDNASGAQGIYVERAPVSGGSFVRVGQTYPTNTTYTQAGVNAGEYVYRVQAYNATNMSAYSNSADVRIK